MSLISINPHSLSLFSRRLPPIQWGLKLQQCLLVKQNSSTGQSLWSLSTEEVENGSYRSQVHQTKLWHFLAVVRCLNQFQSQIRQLVLSPRPEATKVQQRGIPSAHIILASANFEMTLRGMETGSSRRRQTHGIPTRSSVGIGHNDGSYLRQIVGRVYPQ